MSQNTMTAAIVGEPEVLEDETGVEITAELIALADGVEADPAWVRLKESATRLQALQVKDGSVPEASDQPEASATRSPADAATVTQASPTGVLAQHHVSPHSRSSAGIPCWVATSLQPAAARGTTEIVTPT